MFKQKDLLYNSKFLSFFRKSRVQRIRFLFLEKLTAYFFFVFQLKKVF